MPKNQAEALPEKAKHRIPQTIELDCPPGPTRPGDLIGEVIKGMGLPERKAVSKLFENWMWDYSDIPEEDWNKWRDLRKKRVTELYDSGTIRYGSW